MPLIQKYHNLSEKKPKPGQKVILYRRNRNNQYVKVRTEGVFTYHKSSSDGSVYFIGASVGFYIIDSREKHLYQFLIHKDLNKLQRWVGEYYLGFIPIALIIYWIFF